MKILVNALSGIGDALMFTPSLKILRKYLPESEIHILAMFRAVKEIYSANPDVNRIHYIDFINQPWFKSLKQVLQLRKEKFDASMNVYPSNRKEYNLINYLIGAKLKIASSYNHLSRRELDFLNNRLNKETKDLHNVMENFRLIKFLIPEIKETQPGNLKIYIPLESEVYARKFIIDHSLQNTFNIGIHPGSATFKGHVNKRWDTAKYIELLKILNNHYKAKILIFGSEKDLNQEIYEKIKDFGILIPADGILNSAALMKKCSLFISGDTGLMHIAAALLIPQIAIFGYTNHRELHPWMNWHIIVRKDLPCSPCFYNSPRPVKCIYKNDEMFKCIKTITVAEVFEACRKLIEEVPCNIKA